LLDYLAGLDDDSERDRGRSGPQLHDRRPRHELELDCASGVANNWHGGEHARLAGICAQVNEAKLDVLLLGHDVRDGLFALVV
jgi:hypothetical protein